MKALRQIVEVNNHKLNIFLPADFDANRVEVIILPVEEQKSEKGIANLRGKLKLTDKQYNEFQADVKKSRKE